MPFSLYTRALFHYLLPVIDSTILSAAQGFTEIRVHKKRSRSLAVRRGEISDISTKELGGAAVRVLYKGAWGFASTSDLTPESLKQALSSALAMARSLEGRVKHFAELAKANLARGTFTTPGFEDLDSMSMAEKLALVRTSEERIRKEQGIQSAFCQYAEIFEEKQILTTDGASCIVRTARPELRFGAFAEEAGRVTSGFDAIGTTGSWHCLFEKRPVDSFIETAAKSARDLLHAPAASGGRHTVILSPAMVGLLSHEAIGHTVEADFVKSGSAAQGKLGQIIASELVTLCDSGVSEIAEHAGGTIPVDDEGVVAGRTVIIEQGKLVSYLHNRQSAAEFGVKPTGNARAWEYTDEPLIRMRNTYIEPGKDKLEDMISGIEDGYFVDGPEGGQADATADFMFGASRVHRIRGGKISELVQKVTVSGNAFEALASVDAVSSDFAWDLGSGHCGKGQPAKVDAGGPYLRLKLLVGGEQ